MLYDWAALMVLTIVRLVKRPVALIQAVGDDPQHLLLRVVVACYCGYPPPLNSLYYSFPIYPSSQLSLSQLFPI